MNTKIDASYIKDKQTYGANKTNGINNINYKL